MNQTNSSKRWSSKMKVFQHDKKTDQWVTVSISNPVDARQFIYHLDSVAAENPDLEFVLGRNQLDAIQKLRLGRERQATALFESIAEKAPGRVTADTIRRYCSKFGTQATFDDIPQYEDYQDYLENWT